MTTAQRSARQVRAILADHGRRGPEYALVECIDCEARARIEQSARRTDAELEAEFVALGWTVDPTRCPRHAQPKPDDSGSHVVGREDER